MIIAEITAGLGNQLFQYAHAKNISLIFDLPLKLDLSFYEKPGFEKYFRLDKFNTKYLVANRNEIERLKRRIPNNIINKSLNKIFKRKYFRNAKRHIDETSFNYDIEKLRSYSEFYLSGYWADEKFFKESEIPIRKEFKLKKNMQNNSQEFANAIKETNSVSLHIRRGDYVNNPYFNELTLDYYGSAIKQITKKTRNPHFFIFSDDMAWVKDQMSYQENMTFRNFDKNSTDYEDLILMSLCNHNIIANSTFSWWGAWLNDNPNKIIYAPTIWYNNQKFQRLYASENMIPKEWLKI